MSPHHWFARVVLFALLAISATWSNPAFAQPRRVKAKGEVVSVIGNTITLIDGAKNVLTVKPKADFPLVEVFGPWKLEEIQLGMIVRISGAVKANSLTDELTELTLHSPADGYQPAIEQDSPDHPATIVGQFVRIKDRQLTIAIGKRRINAKLAPDAAAKVESKDLRFVRKGDAIEIDAYTTSSGTLSGRTIKVTIQPPKAAGGQQPTKGANTPIPKRTVSPESTQANQDPAK
ncbi:MAG TPA: hypothetical protein VFB96_06100 [Pirellulaceae bacterium]|jgi:hypothetical protein|nr:hypothetical protein [Pirellulaceae bacterium]